MEPSRYGQDIAHERSAQIELENLPLRIDPPNVRSRKNKSRNIFKHVRCVRFSKEYCLTVTIMIFLSLLAFCLGVVLPIYNIVYCSQLPANSTSRFCDSNENEDWGVEDWGDSFSSSSKTKKLQTGKISKTLRNVGKGARVGSGTLRNVGKGARVGSGRSGGGSSRKG